MTTQAAREAIHQCQTRLWELVKEAAERRDGNVVIELTELANSIACLVDRSDDRAAHPAEDVIAAPSLSVPVRKRLNRSRRDYPRFLRTKTDMIKLGWSKSRKSEYQHRAPLALALRVAAAIEVLGARGKRFTAQELLEVVAAKDDVPSYQVYVVLAWLRVSKIVVRIGRQGYQVSSRTRVLPSTQSLIQKLPET